MNVAELLVQVLKRTWSINLSVIESSISTHCSGLLYLFTMPKATKASTSLGTDLVAQVSNLFHRRKSADDPSRLACGCYKCIKKNQLTIPRRSYYRHAKYRAVTVNGELGQASVAGPSSEVSPLSKDAHRSPNGSDIDIDVESVEVSCI